MAGQIIASIQYAMGGFECIDWKGDSGGAVSDGFDMIWLSHLIGAVTRSAPALHPSEIAWDIPLAFSTHLAAQTAGTCGASIHRPFDIGAAISQQQQKANFDV